MKLLQRILTMKIASAYSQTLRNALIEFSDHLPVVMEVETPENTLSVDRYSSTFNSQFDFGETYLNLSIGTHSGIKKLGIYNTIGQLIQLLNINDAENTFTINVEHLSKGIYYLSAQNLNKSQSL